MSVGGLLEQESSCPKVVQLKDKSQYLQQGFGADKAQHGYQNTKDEDWKGFLPHFVRVWEYIVTGFGDVGL